MADPTIVLVHGAFADASSWRRLYAELAGDRLMIKAPPNPLRGVTVEDAEYTRCVIEQVEGPVLLVGHSYGGAVISAAGVADNVVGLVYVAGFAPDEGEDLGSLQSNFPGAADGPYVKPSPLPDGATEFTIDPSRFHEAFCADLPAAEAAFMAISQRPLSGSCLRRESAHSRLADTPVMGGPAGCRRRDPSRRSSLRLRPDGSDSHRRRRSVTRGDALAPGSRR